ncbi:hypothetical protein HYPSUDRAFT_108447, partial [Hypholoma sublateritium FD-334 SS-4]
TPSKLMPGRSHHSAPKFNGKPWSLKRFLNEVRELGKERSLSEHQTILAALSYAPLEDYELWKSLGSASGQQWEPFVAELCTLYPGSDGDRKYNRENLDALTCSSALVPMTDHLQFGEYYRSFLTITTFLKSKNRISDQECSSKFLEGLHYRFRAELGDYLRIKEPSHHIDDPWALTTLYKSALFVLSNHLRCIKVEIPGGHVVDAILDDGSQIVMLRADFWHKVGRALWTDHLLVMESANQSTNDTQGLLPDLPIKVGDHTFYIQAQVVESVSYEMLLGRPFLTLCQANTHHFKNGDAHITLINPNTQATITIPT